MFGVTDPDAGVIVFGARLFMFINPLSPPDPNEDGAAAGLASGVESFVWLVRVVLGQEHRQQPQLPDVHRLVRLRYRRCRCLWLPPLCHLCKYVLCD
jgi:hypothetical protein